MIADSEAALPTAPSRKKAPNDGAAAGTLRIRQCAIFDFGSFTQFRGAARYAEPGGEFDVPRGQRVGMLLARVVQNRTSISKVSSACYPSWVRRREGRASWVACLKWVKRGSSATAIVAGIVTIIVKVVVLRVVEQGFGTP
jgi:hypothetical protein